MMGIQGVGMQNVSQMREMMQNSRSFFSGETNVSLDDLETLQGNLSSNGIEATNIQSMIDSFSEIDSNGDEAISIDEVQSYEEETGVSFKPDHPPRGAMGPPPGMQMEEESENSYIDQLLGSLSSGEETDSEDSYLDKLLKSVYSQTSLTSELSSLSFSI